MKYVHPSLEPLCRQSRWGTPLFTALSPRVLARLLLAIGILLIAHAAYLEAHGIGAPPYYARSGRDGPRHVLDPATAHKKFRELMNGEWLLAALFLIGGGFIHGVVRRAGQRDPFSPDFSGNTALDECERVLDAEIDRHHRPLR